MLAAVIVLATVAGILAIAIVVSIVYDLKEKAVKPKATSAAKLQPKPQTPPKPQSQPNNQWNKR